MGQPVTVKRYHTDLNVSKQTQGTETSKYLEEKKTTVIAPVVASERATAQTRLVTAGWG